MNLLKKLIQQGWRELVCAIHGHDENVRSVRQRISYCRRCMRIGWSSRLERLHHQGQRRGQR